MQCNTCLNLIRRQALPPRPMNDSTPFIESNTIKITPGMETMKRAVAILGCVCAVMCGLYFSASKWAIRHETLNLFDAARQRPVAVDVAVRRDYEMKAD